MLRCKNWFLDDVISESWKKKVLFSAKNLRGEGMKENLQNFPERHITTDEIFIPSKVVPQGAVVSSRFRLHCQRGWQRLKFFFWNKFRFKALSLQKFKLSFPNIFLEHSENYWFKSSETSLSFLAHFRNFIKFCLKINLPLLISDNNQHKNTNKNLKNLLHAL